MKKSIAILSILSFAAAITGFYACKHEPYKQPVEVYGGFPDDVGKIITTRCATSGCHNANSYTAAGNLRLDSWDQLFYGGNHGAAVVPYSVPFSPILFYINTDTAVGPVSPDNRMPPVDAGTALSTAEYNTIRNWIANGAPDRNGNVAFADKADSRQKIYVTQQGCDQVAVIDAERKVIMRYIAVGAADNIESPHVVRVSPDNQSAYVCFTGGLFMQKINTSTDKMTEQVKLASINTTGTPSWNILYIAPDGKKVLACNYQAAGNVVQYDAGTFSFQKFFDRMKFPHGVTSTADFDTMYVSSQWGNTVYKMPANLTDFTLIQKISLNGQAAVQYDSKQSGQPDPHEIMITPDGSKIIVTCQSSNEVKILDAKTNQVLKTFTVSDGVGVMPQEIAMSRKNPYAYISCSDTSNTQQYTGSVFIFNYQTMQPVQTITANQGSFNQPHGIAVDDKDDVLYVININSSTSGPPPHHVTSCGGKNGYYNIFKSTPPFTPVNLRKYEMLTAPYSADVRFK